MFDIILYTFLLSISPIGEARAGIPYAVLNDLHVGWAFLVGLTGNLLVFPLLMWLIDTFSAKLWPNRRYRKGVVHFSRRAKKGVGAEVEKYGFWGLMVFVMIPLPGTGAYMGTIAAYVLKIERRKAFLATSLGVIVSCIIMAVGSYYGNLGWKSL
ncbi:MULTISPECIES: COG2426 family protein [Rufibacter]|uniref:Putative membrane protein n=1 Tax=Rufibacter quisquiliarum TaxID=1549639 RepID=A0A839GRR5_9BACT|nr:MULTISPECIES: small multi-drug export protein [Rufibacter]MBA9079549.1 putative membrane protein [Rufibacter quisquiliarum]